jgi:hypothetical protein
VASCSTLRNAGHRYDDPALQQRGERDLVRQPRQRRRAGRHRLDPGFYFIWRTGLLNDDQGQSDLLPSGVQYAVQLCNGTTQLGPIKTTDSKLHSQEFEQVDFDNVTF